MLKWGSLGGSGGEREDRQKSEAEAMKEKPTRCFTGEGVPQGAGLLKREEKRTANEGIRTLCDLRKGAK